MLQERGDPPTIEASEKHSKGRSDDGRRNEVISLTLAPADLAKPNNRAPGKVVNPPQRTGYFAADKRTSLIKSINCARMGVSTVELGLLQCNKTSTDARTGIAETILNWSVSKMKFQSYPRRAAPEENFERRLLRMYEYIDHAIPPLATAFLVAGLMTTALHIQRTSHYMLASGLLLHLTVWFAKWLFTCRRS